MKSSELISKFQRMYREHWSYELGKAEEGCVDCSGAFTLTLGLPHGSNTIYRKSIGWVTQTPIAGYAAFKIRKDGQEPKKYQGDGIGNVYHIGLVDSDGKHILNAKGERYGFCRDDLRGWTCYAPINGVDYGEKHMEYIFKGIVDTTSGNLNLRSDASTKAQVITSIPKGETVSVIGEVNGGWLHVMYGDIEGYVKRSFIAEIEGSDEEQFTHSETTTLLNEEGVAVTLVGRWRIAAD